MNNTSGKSTLLSDNSTNEIVTKSSEVLESESFDENYIGYFNEGTAEIPDFQASHISTWQVKTESRSVCRFRKRKRPYSPWR